MDSSDSVSASRNRPSSTSSQLSNSTPSSCTSRLVAGIEPGVMPPISAWWPRDATKNSSSSSAENTGVTTVTSGRCVPPW